MSSARVVDRSDSSSSRSGEAAREVGRRDVFPLYARDGSFGARRVHDDACRSVVASSLASESASWTRTRGRLAHAIHPRAIQRSQSSSRFISDDAPDGWRRTRSLDDAAAAVRSHPRTEGARRHFVAGRRSRSSHLRSERPTIARTPYTRALLRFGAAVARGAWVCAQAVCWY